MPNPTANITEYRSEQTNNFSEAVPPLLQRLYLARGISCDDDVQYSLDKLHHFSSLKDIDKASHLLISAIEQQQTIVIIGDFDVDGATSTSLLLHGLTQLGVQNIHFLIPNRITDGYGLTPKIVELAYNTYAPDLLITVDNGIASIDGVARAREFNIKVLITDHHLPGTQLPNADAIVNPNQDGCNFPSKNLAGVGVAFYLLIALRDQLQQQNWFINNQIKPLNLGQFLDLVALGTIADLVKLDSNNRILAQQGLLRIRRDKCCAGIRALLQVSNTDMATLSSSDIGFAIAPKLNAAGRLDDMSIGIRCLLANNPAKAMSYAIELDNLNKQRRALQKDMYREANMVVENLEIPEQVPTSLCLLNPQWHQGLVGIIASNIKDKINRPTIVFTTNQAGELVGSARSIDGLHIRDALEAVATRHPNILNKFGGHAMAAGLTIEEQHYSEFEQAFNQQVASSLPADKLVRQYYTDGALLPEFFSCKTAIMLRTSAPWGNGFAQPCFIDKFTVISYKLVGEHHLKLSLQHANDDQILDAIWFYAKFDNIEKNSVVTLLYNLDVQQYLGKQRLQFIVQYIKPY
jgi:single-stranded-DNA-specific exonuclease